jgi:regulator of sigma E protease
MVSMLAFMAVFTLVVLVHEFGHYWAAKKSGVKVYEFSIGFPFSPKLITLFHYKETSFTIRLLPLGGFVSFSPDGGEGDAELFKATRKRRAFILSAGSFSNMLFAFLIFVAVFIIGRHQDPVSAALLSAKTIWSILSGTFAFLMGAITGHGTLGSVSGPVGIAVLTGKAAAKGFMNLCFFTGILSMSLGIMNLLPLPALDGGHLAMLFIESIRRKALSPKIYQVATVVGLAFFIAFTVIITYKDIAKFFA